MSVFETKKDRRILLSQNRASLKFTSQKNPH